MGDIAQGRIVQDKNNVGGIHRIFFIKYDEATNSFPTTVEYDATNTDQIAQLLNGGSVTGETLTIYQYDFQNSGATFEETEANSRDNGTVKYDQVLTLPITRFSAQDALDTYALATSRWAIIVEGKNGDRRLVGLDYGAEKSGTSNIGGTMEDGTNASYVFTAMTKRPANFLSADALSVGTGEPGFGITIQGV